MWIRIGMTDTGIAFIGELQRNEPDISFSE